MYYALYDCPLRVVVDAPQSKIGYTYHRLFIESKPLVEVINVDLTLGACFKMEPTDFEEWFSTAQPISTSDVCQLLNFNEDAFREAIRCMIPDTCTVKW